MYIEILTIERDNFRQNRGDLWLVGLFLFLSMGSVTRSGDGLRDGGVRFRRFSRWSCTGSGILCISSPGVHLRSND